MDIAVRAFGQLDDLDLDLSGAYRPMAVTALLAHCAGPDCEHWQAQPVGARTATLLQLLSLSAGAENLELNATCVDPRCGEVFSFDLPLSRLSALAPSADEISLTLPDGRALALRRATGHDLLRWQAARPATREQAMQLMLDDLVVRGHAEIDDEFAVSSVLDAQDPLVAFTLSAECPACGGSQDVAVDLEGLVLTHFDRCQHALLHDVHRLAAHYGWSEQQAMAVPARRRASYLALIDGASP